MTTDAGSPLNVLLFSIMHLTLLCGFLPRRTGLSRRRAALMLAGWLALLYAANACFKRESLSAYLYMLLLCGAMYAFACPWSGYGAMAAAQRVLCLFMVTDCAMLTVSHIAILVWGADVLRSAPLPWRILSVALLYLLCRVLLMLVRRFLPGEACADRNSLWMSVLSAVPYLFISQITCWLPVTSAQLTFAVPLMVCASCLLSVLLMVSLEGRLSAEREKRQALAQKHMMELRQQQFAYRKDSVETVRRYYHDMKNLLLYLEQTAARREGVKAQVQRILTETNGCETLLDTGNEAADILLGDKMAVCRREGITCTVMLDGALLSFIGELDLVTILGNAMDNAIEACRLLPPQRPRYVQVRTRETTGFILLHVINSCTGEARMEGNRFLTLKEDAENHGFGLSSIRRAAAAYQGEMACRMQEGEFSLSLIFPREESTAWYQNPPHKPGRKVTR